ncbi:hypothetical protein KKA27_00175 [Patescibacteria group bacterium]|nr:hypothetical protein [Patescibacteria group bacterium]
MPYIEKKRRSFCDPSINRLLETWGYMKVTDVAGEFTYVVYRLLKYFSGKFWMRALGIGCLVCAMLEMYRKEHAPYEDQKMKENGDV